MTSRSVKPMLALLLVVAVGLAFAARTGAAPAAGLNWEVHGTGSGSASLTAGSSSGPAMPQHIGNATYSLSLSSPGFMGSNGVLGLCEFITGSGTIEAADLSHIFFVTVGVLCNEVGLTSTLEYNGTYRIVGGDGRFVTGVVGGGGSLTATFGSPHFIKFDGTITGI